MFSSEDTERRRVVVIVTRTKDSGAVCNWHEGLSRLGCGTVMVEPDNLMQYLREKKPMDSVMLDDVYPPDTPEMRELASVLTHMRPEPRIAFLVARYDDYHDLQHLLGSNGRAVVHHDGAPMMEVVYEHLAGVCRFVETPAVLFH